MNESFKPGHPARLRLKLGDHQLVFSCDADNRYCVEVDLKRAHCTIRTRQQRREVC